MRIAVVAPSCTLKREAAERVQAIVAERGDCELVVHPQCFLSDGHFAGPDEARLAALREVMADPAVDAVWFARGGYGSNRIAEAALVDLPEAARGKMYFGYSDAGFLLAGFHKAGLDVAWGPMPQDVVREGGEAAVNRALDWLVRRDLAALEPELEGAGHGVQPDGALEPARNAARARLHRRRPADRGCRASIFTGSTGRCSTSPPRRTSAASRGCGSGGSAIFCPTTPISARDEEAIVEDWCRRSGIPYGGRADIGHDARNRVVPFGPNSTVNLLSDRAIAKALDFALYRRGTTGGP